MSAGRRRHAGVISLKKKRRKARCDMEVANFRGSGRGLSALKFVILFGIFQKIEKSGRPQAGNVHADVRLRALRGILGSNWVYAQRRLFSVRNFFWKNLSRREPEKARRHRQSSRSAGAIQFEDATRRGNDHMRARQLEFMGLVGAA
jgi:hypothetical protein